MHWPRKGAGEYVVRNLERLLCREMEGQNGTSLDLTGLDRIRCDKIVGVRNAIDFNSSSSSSETWTNAYEDIKQSQYIL
jgi:hypothetical protein